MFRLSSKIILAFSIIFITGTILTVTIINYTTRTGYESFVKENDKVLAKRLVTVLEDYYAIDKTWDGLEVYLQNPKPRMIQAMDGNKRRVTSYPSLILTDKNNNIVINTQSNKNSSFIKLSDHGSPIKYSGKIVGYVYVGSMIEKGLSSEEEQFLKNVKTIIVLVSIFILGLSILFIYFFTRKITKPISDLSKATFDIEKGDYKIRVKTTGNDEISHLSESFNKMAQSIESNDTWRKQIIADSAHELRTPVTLIQGNLEMILDGVYKPDITHLQGIYDETLVLARLIKELQELSSAESGSMELNIEDINLPDIIENCMDIFKPEEIKKNITFSRNIEDNLPSVKGDFQKLKQVFTNILTNAFRHTPNNGDISIKIYKNKNFISIEISDSGSGIPIDELEKIFQRFYRLDSSRNRTSGGSGLGLAISREIIKLHKGTIHAESKIDSGAKFIITLPF